MVSDGKEECYVVGGYYTCYSGLLDEVGVKEVTWDEALTSLMLKLLTKASHTTQMWLKRLAIVSFIGENSWTVSPGFSADAPRKIYQTHCLQNCSIGPPL